MKVIAVSDWHLDHTTHGVSRFEELRELVNRTVDVAIEEGAQAYVFAGDLCDPDSGSVVFRCLAAAIEAADRLSSRAIDSIWVAGNHDVIEDGTGDTTLSPMRSLGECVHVCELPSVVRIGKIDFVVLPFTATSRGYDVESTFLHLVGDTPKERLVSVSHLSVPGVEPGEETKEMPRGREVVLPVDVVTARAGLVINGHYHRQQRTKDGVWIPGSLARLTFCEERHDPGYLVVEV